MSQLTIKRNNKHYKAMRNLLKPRSKEYKEGYNQFINKEKIHNKYSRIFQKHKRIEFYRGMMDAFNHCVQPIPNRPRPPQKI